MKLLNPRVDIERFFQQVAAVSTRALLLDYDGTLAPFRIRRDEAVPYPEVREILETILAGGHTRVVIVSGRDIKQLLPLLGLEKHPEIWGSHGWEHLLPDGTYKLGRIDEVASAGLTRAEAWAREIGPPENWERKPVSLAFHWRGLEAETARRLKNAILDRWHPLTTCAGLFIHEFDGGIELRVPGRDKGSAVNAVLAELGEGAIVAYLGDDRTDEDAFKAIKNKGLGILVRREFRPTEADIWLTPPGDLVEFLTSWNTAAEGG